MINNNHISSYYNQLFSKYIANNEYIYPNDWIKLPVTNAGEFYALVAVFNVGVSLFTALFSSNGKHHIDWGDGTSEDVWGDIRCEHTYNYSSLPDNSICSRGYKQVLIKVSGDLTGVNLGYVPSGNPVVYYSNILALSINIHNPVNVRISTVGSQMKHNMLEFIDFNNCTGNLDNGYGAFNDCYSLQQILNYDTSSITNFGYAFTDCHMIKKLPNMNTSNTTSFDVAFTRCYSLMDLNNIDFSSATSIYNAFAQTFSLQNIDLSNSNNIQNFSSAFYEASRITSIDINVSSGTTFGSSMFFSNRYLRKLRLRNMNQNLSEIDVRWSMLNVNELVTLFGDLYNRSSTTSGTINISGCLGATNLTNEQKAIATGKNWTLIVS